MELNKKDIEKLNSITRLLRKLLSEMEEIMDKVDQPSPPRKRRNLKQERIEKYLRMIDSGRMFRKRK